MTVNFVLVVVALTATVTSATAEGLVFRLLDPPCEAHWVTHALSSDGRVMAVNAGGHYYLWTPTGGYADLGPGHELTASVGISGDGTTVCGTILDQNGHRMAAIWRDGSGWTPLADVKHGNTVDGNLGSGYATNQDGSVAVGLAWSATGAAAFRWTAKTGSVRLPDSGHGSRASDAARRADVVVGFDEHPRTGHRRPARWVDERLQLIGQPDQTGEVLAVDAGGIRCCGQLDSRAFYLDNTAGLVDLGVLGGSPWDQSLAADVSDRGVVVGWSGAPAWDDLTAFVWTAGSGMLSLRDWLTDLGAEIPEHVFLSDALEISGDGSTILGAWRDADDLRGTWLVTGLSATAYDNLPVAESEPDTSWQSPSDRQAWPPPPTAPGRPIRPR